MTSEAIHGIKNAKAHTPSAPRRDVQTIKNVSMFATPGTTRPDALNSRRRWFFPEAVFTKPSFDEVRWDVFILYGFMFLCTVPTRVCA